MLFLGIDSGTQSTKTVVLDLETGKIIAQASESYDLIDGLPDGHLEQNPQDWIDATQNTISSCVQQIGDRKSEVRGIGVSGQQHGCVTLDGDDQVVRPAKLWCDTSTQEQCDEFAAEFGGQDGLIELAGNAMLPGYTAPKILWLDQNEPDNFAATQSVLLPHDYLNFWLTGVKRMEYGDASGMGFLNVRERQWEQQLLDFIDPRVTDMLPPLGSSREVHGELRPELAEQLGLPSGVLVSAGGGDNMMGAIGTGNIKAGVITASFGTSGTLYGCSDKPIVDPKGEVAAFCDSADQWLPLVCTMNVTVTTEQVRSLFGWEIEQLENAVSSAEPGAGGLTFLPYLNGERTPNLPNGSGVMHGLKTGNFTQENLARAAMEGATLGLAYGLRRFQELGLEPTEIRLTGGGSQSPTWRQISADAFGVPVVCLSTAEGASLGAALQAAYAWNKANGTEQDYESLCAGAVELDESTRAEPNSAAAELYASQLDKLSGLTQTLAAAGHL
ncbi:MAG: xylulokinase [Verrucomicrobiota bacterium]